MQQMTRYQVLAAAAAAFAAVPLGGSAQSLPKVRVSGVPTDDVVAVLYAVHSGAYQKAGLDVEYTPASSGTAATAAVVAGSYDIAKASPIASMVAYLRGLPLTTLGGSAMWDPRHPVNLSLVASDSPYHTGADLNGKIGATAGLNDINTLSISAWVDKTGGDSRTMKWVEIPNSAAAAALRAHRIDIASMIEPEISDALAKGGVRVIAPAFSAIAPRFHIAVYNANADWVAKNPEVARKWLQTTMEVGAYCNAHHAETIDTVAQATKIPAEIIAKMPRAEATTNATNGPAYLQPLIDVAANYKNIPHAFAAVDMFWTGR